MPMIFSTVLHGRQTIEITVRAIFALVALLGWSTPSNGTLQCRRFESIVRSYLPVVLRLVRLDQLSALRKETTFDSRDR